LQHVQVPATHGHAQALTTNAVALAAQGSLKSAGTVAALMATKDGFPCWFALR
jgi:hypothetical protein